MYVDFKITIWERLHVSTDKEEEVLKKLKNGAITSGNDIHEIDEDASHEILVETEEQVTPEGNNGDPTIEAYCEQEETPIYQRLIFSNQKTK